MGTPGIVPASGHRQHPTQSGQRIVGAQRHHHCVPGSCAFAKYAVAFFKMSRSIRVSASSRFRRETSASSSVTGRRVSPSSASRPCRARTTQFASVLSEMASRLAASGVVHSYSSTSRTACARNSFVYFCRGTRSIPYLQTLHCRLKASTFSSLAQFTPRTRTSSP